jgi:hypothetical protein
MKLALAAMVAAGVLMAVPAAQTRPRSVVLPPSPGITWCNQAAHTSRVAMQIPGFGDLVAACMHGHRMRRDVRNCLIATAVTLAGVAVGDIIGAVAARAIAGDMVKAGTAVCVSLIVGT